MQLAGTFYNPIKKITITFNHDGSYILKGMPGYDTEFGAFKIIPNPLKAQNCPYAIELKHSTRMEDIHSTGTITAGIQFLDNNRFTILLDAFLAEGFDGIGTPTIFNRV